jgi:alpha-beta hydrolase superfamily lysophospholipase
VEAREWHRVLACRDNALDATRRDAAVFEYKYWRWRGFLVRYARTAGGREEAYVCGAAEAAGIQAGGAVGGDAREAEVRGALVLVHGFGASADQWRGLMGNLKRSGGVDVWAIDLLGFGHRCQQH